MSSLLIIFVHDILQTFTKYSHHGDVCFTKNVNKSAGLTERTGSVPPPPPMRSLTKMYLHNSREEHIIYLFNN